MPSSGSGAHHVAPRSSGSGAQPIARSSGSGGQPIAPRSSASGPHPSPIGDSGSGPHRAPLGESSSGAHPSPIGGTSSIVQSIIDSNDETDAVQSARRAERNTVAGVKRPGSAASGLHPPRGGRRLPLMADRSAPIPKLDDLDDDLAPRLPTPPPMQARSDAPRGLEGGARLPLRAAPPTPAAGNMLPRAGAPDPAQARADDRADRDRHHDPRERDRAARDRDDPADRDRAAHGSDRADRDRALHDRADRDRVPHDDRGDRDRMPRGDRPDRDRADRDRDRNNDRVDRAADRAERAADRADRGERAGDRAERVAPLLDAKRAEPAPRSAMPGAASREAGRQPPAAGRVIAGRYQILERIGAGGMGKVYKVRHAQLAKTFALKVIGENLADTDEARDLFYREARLASAVNHPNITSVVDFGEDPDVGAFMVMELVEGEPVHRILRRENRLSPRLACEIILQVADALHYIHSEGIVHCDIKTENILVAEQTGTKRRQILVKLLDFGLARSLTGGRGSGPLSGTPHYVSPERIRGDAATPSSDLYALGILFYELLTGHVPWDGAVSNILSGHLDQPPTPPSSLVPGLDPALEKLILRALAKTPADRHKDMAAFIYELRTAMDMMGFGGRRRGGGKRVVIERSKNERDALAARVVDGCRLPLALVSRDGVILVANPACARFVMGVVVEIEGLPLLSTPLAGAWRSLADDLARAAASSPIRRILEIDVPNGPPQRLMVWLDPCGDAILFGVQPLDA